MKGVPLVAAAAVGVAIATHLPAPTLASALTGLLGVAVLGGGLLAGRPGAWPRAVATIGAVGLLAFPPSDTPLLALPVWVSVLVVLLFLHRLHAPPGNGPRKATFRGSIRGTGLTAAALAIPVLAAAKPGLAPIALGASREATIGGAALLAGLAIFCIGAGIHLLRAATTRLPRNPEGFP